VDLTAHTTLAPASSTPDDPGASLEHSVGEIVAAAAVTLAQGLREMERGKLTLRTKMKGGDLVFELFKLRQFLIADFDFDRICREHGRIVLLEASGADVDARTIEILVDGVLDVLARVVRAAVN